MKLRALLSTFFLSMLVVGSGCQSGSRPKSWVRLPGNGGTTNALVVTNATQQASKPLSPSENQKRIKAQIKNLERSLGQHRKAQAKIDRELERTLRDLSRAREETRGLEQKTNQLFTAHAANKAKLQAVETELIQQRSLLTDQVRTASSAVSTSPKDVDALRQALEQERQERAREEAIAREREKEVEDLRRALAARDEMLKKQSASAPVQPEVKPIEKIETPKVEAQPIVSTPTKDVSSDSPHKLVADGNTKLKEGDLAGAQKLFQAALVQNPAFIGARLGLAACHYGWGELTEAKTTVDAVLKEDANNAQALGLRAMIYWREDDARSASDLLSKALKVDPKDSQLHNYMGIVLHARKRHDEAISELRKAVELDAQNSEAHFNLAVLLATSRKPQLAVAKQHYDIALRLGNERDPALDKILYPGVTTP